MCVTIFYKQVIKSINEMFYSLHSFDWKGKEAIKEKP